MLCRERKREKRYLFFFSFKKKNIFFLNFFRPPALFFPPCLSPIGFPFLLFK